MMENIVKENYDITSLSDLVVDYDDINFLFGELISKLDLEQIETTFLDNSFRSSGNTMNIFIDITRSVSSVR